MSGDGVTAFEMAAASGRGSFRPTNVTRSSPLHGYWGANLPGAGAWCRTIIIGIGGGATNDGGAGMMQALGAAS